MRQSYVQAFITGPSEIQKKVNAFYKEMMERYPDFEVISTDSATMPTGICFGITFKV